MITGTGIDIIEVARVQQKIEKEQGFRELVFNPGEIDYCESNAHKYQHYAARFAAKEAFLKALGTGWASGIAFNEIVILNNADGKPELILTGETANTLKHINVPQIQVSLSHIKDTAVAIVIIEA